MKKIICFGDSNTFGFNPHDCSRYDSDTRWTSVLANILGDEFDVVEEGCNNRTGFFKNPDGVMQSGQEYLPLCLKKHKDFEIFVLALGTNDLQKFFKLDEKFVKNGLKNLISGIRKFNPNSRIIIIPPVLLNNDVVTGTFGYQFDEGSVKDSIWIQDVYKLVARQENCEISDFNKYVTPLSVDGLHFDPKSHKVMAEQVAKQILDGEYVSLQELAKAEGKD